MELEDQIVWDEMISECRTVLSGKKAGVMIRVDEYIRALLAERDALKEKLRNWEDGWAITEEDLQRVQVSGSEEARRMALVAISVVANANTPHTAEHVRLPKNHPYWTVAHDDVCAAVDREMSLRAERDALLKRADVAMITAHRACHNQEQDPGNGKLAGYCVVCGILWPCDYADPGKLRADLARKTAECAAFFDDGVKVRAELAAIRERAEDDRLGQMLWLYDAPKADPDEWLKFTPRLKYPYIMQARAVSTFLLKVGQ